MKAKTSKPDKFTEKQQERLNDVTEQIIDLEEQIELAEDESPKEQVQEAKPEDKSPKEQVQEAKPKDESPKEQVQEAKPENKNGYIPKPGTEKLVHVKLVRGRRFDENTGKEISSPYIQMFTFGEYKNFKKNASLIGYTIVEELYNPYKE